jgi:hypothetical protein
MEARTMSGFNPARKAKRTKRELLLQVESHNTQTIQGILQNFAMHLDEDMKVKRDFIILKPEYRNHFTGYIQWNTIFRPTVLTDVKPAMHVAQEEIFGPVTAVIVAQEEIFGPVTAVMGGTKVDDSIAVMAHMLDHGIADSVVVTGVVANASSSLPETRDMVGSRSGVFSIRRVLAIARKELRQLVRDRLTMAMIVGIPAR